MMGNMNGAAPTAASSTGIAHMNNAPRKSMSKRRWLVICGSVALGLGIVLSAAGIWSGHRGAVWGGLSALIVGAIWLICARSTEDEPMRTEERRYLREVFPAMAAYMLLLSVSRLLLSYEQAVPLKVLIALLPVLPIVFVVRAMVRRIMASDELERRLQLEAISIASMSVGLLSFAAAFLRGAGLLPIDNALMLVLPALFGTYGIAQWWVRRRYRGE